MRGRTPAALLAQVERWHRELGRAAGAENVYFRRSGIKELALKTGKDGARPSGASASFCPAPSSSPKAAS